MSETVAVLHALAAPTGGGRPPSPLTLLLLALHAVVATICATHEGPLAWRAEIARALLPRVTPPGLIALRSPDLAILRSELRELIAVLDWDARRQRWWPGLRAQLELLVGDIEAEISQRVAA